MSDPIETGGRSLASTILQLEGSSQPSTLRRKRTTSQSSDERTGGTKFTASRRLGARKEASLGPRTSSSRGESSTMQRSNSPTQLSPEMAAVNYTRTGRISKAKKGLKVHNCECGRSYTRAEHLRRHQKNHKEDVLRCKFPECDKTFVRIDLLQRHEERHNEVGKEMRQSPVFDQDASAETGPHISAAAALPMPVVTTVPHTMPYYNPQAVSPVPEPTTTSRYTPTQFRTPQDPSLASRHILRSSPNFKPHLNHSTKRASYGPYQTSVTIPVSVDGMSSGAWNDQYSHSPNYSSSSGYASPVPGAADYTNMFANHPYRTRTSSNASFIEAWAYPSRSPTSTTSTTVYPWTSTDKSGVSVSLGYMNPTSFPLTSMPMSTGVDPGSAYSHFGPKSMAQRDEEEQAFLFPEQSFGMSHVANTYPFEQYLDSYWRLFHPSFPVVHRATFDGINDSPMLRAAMIAIGAQYSHDTNVKRKSRILHDRCLKLLDKRDLDTMTDAERLCDYQALFLIEVLSQYRARRAATILSTRFGRLYQKFSQTFQITTASIMEVTSCLAQPENATFDSWKQWIELAGKQRLLLCCYLLEYQQAVLLARPPQASMMQYSPLDLPFPAHCSLWDATSSTDWALASHQYANFPTYVYEAIPDSAVGPFDHFQSLLLIAVYYNHFNNSAPYLSGPLLPAIDRMLDNSLLTRHHLHTAKLMQFTPTRALLAVAGESWILSEKVMSRATFSSLQTTLKSWTNELWAPATGTSSHAVKEAFKLSLELLQQIVLTPSQTLRLEMGADMGLYFALLVMWAITVASSTRANSSHTPSQPVRYQSHSPLSSRSSAHFPTTPTHLSQTPPPGQSPNTAYPIAVGLRHMSRSSPAPLANSMLHTEITAKSIDFLAHAQLELENLHSVSQWPRDVAKWQQGCAALMRWVKMRLRNEASESVADTTFGPYSGPTSAGIGGSVDGHGELLDGAISVLEKLMRRGWDGWGV